MSKVDPKISIIITTKNEEKNIGRCLASIQSQKYPKNAIEIIVVDNNSTDRTVEIAKKQNVQVYTYGPERSAQRNFGMQKAKGRYLLYLDADMELQDTVLEKIDETMSGGKLAGLYINEIIMGDGYLAKARSFERSFYTGTVVDCVRVVSRKVFVKTKGFDESLTGPEDWDFDKRVRQLGRVEVLKGANIRHYEGNIDVGKYIKKKGYYIKSFASYKKKWQGDPELGKQFGLWYRYFGVYLENDVKRKQFVSQWYLAPGMYWLRFLVGWEYLKSRL